MKEVEINRSRWLNIRLKPEEYTVINNRFKKTMCRKMSEYCRSVLLEKTVKVVYRNKGMDDILEELILLRKELHFIGHNFNQVVHKLNSVSGMPEAPSWQLALEVLRDQLEPTIRQIKDRINNYSDLWSQKLSAEKV